MSRADRTIFMIGLKSIRKYFSVRCAQCGLRCSAKAETGIAARLHGTENPVARGLLPCPILPDHNRRNAYAELYLGPRSSAHTRSGRDGAMVRAHVRRRGDPFDAA